MNDYTFFFTYIAFGFLIFFYAERRVLREELRIEKSKNKEADSIISSLLKKQDCPLWSYRKNPPS